MSMSSSVVARAFGRACLNRPSPLVSAVAGGSVTDDHESSRSGPLPVSTRPTTTKMSESPPARSTPLAGAPWPSTGKGRHSCRCAVALHRQGSTLLPVRRGPPRARVLTGAGCGPPATQPDHRDRPGRTTGAVSVGRPGHMEASSDTGRWVGPLAVVRSVAVSPGRWPSRHRCAASARPSSSSTALALAAAS